MARDPHPMRGGRRASLRNATVLEMKAPIGLAGLAGGAATRPLTVRALSVSRRGSLLLTRFIGLRFVLGDSLSRARAGTACHRISDQDPRWHLRAAFLYTCSKAHRGILRMKARLFCRAHWP